MGHISQKTSYFMSGLFTGLIFSSILYALNTDFQKDLVSSVFQMEQQEKKTGGTSIHSNNTTDSSTIKNDFGADIGATGLNEMTPEEIRKLTKFKVAKVHVSDIGEQRVNEERGKKGLPKIERDRSKQEIETISAEGGGEAIVPDNSGTSAIGEALPTQVDNSLLPAFPAIGNQGSLPSCVSWATTYYQMSHQVCLALGCDNKTSSHYIFSPRWTYNMVNGGLLQGTYFSDNYNMIQKHGAVNLNELPYSSDYRSWSLNPDHWKNAINYKIGQLSYISMGTTTGIDQAKQILTNGHVLVVGTYISSAIYTTIKNASGEISPFAGQSTITYLNGTSGGHAMTIVGYDDGIWTDINGNSLEDVGERGAFKVANSWGAGWRNAGYIWVAYDAFMTTSQVPGFAPAGRWPFAYNGTNSLYLVTYIPKTPTYLAKVTVSHALRNQMSLQFGISSNTSKTPQMYSYPFALSYKGGGYAFDGTSIEKSGTFYFDITDISAGVTPSNSIYYLNAYDNISGAPLSVQGFEIIDTANSTVYSGSANIPGVLDQSSTTYMIGTYAGDTTAPTAPTNLAYTLSTTTSKGRKATTTTSVNLTWSASTDNVGVQKYMIYRNGVKLGESTTTKYSDSTTKVGTLYTYYITAVDTVSNVSEPSNTLSVSR